WRCSHRRSRRIPEVPSSTPRHPRGCRPPGTRWCGSTRRGSTGWPTGSPATSRTPRTSPRRRSSGSSGRWRTTRPARSRAGCTGSPPTSSWTWSAAGSGSGSTRCPTTPSGCRAGSAAPSRSTPRAPSTRTCRRRWTRCRRTSAPPSCSVTSRACRTRRSRPRWASSSAPSGPASTAAGCCCGRRWRTAHRGRPAAPPSRIPRPPPREVCR
ncbi:MAG: Alternative RNA polymerase sigma factor SigE, partial [uncultured Corynebacteriales bacterium]